MSNEPVTEKPKGVVLKVVLWDDPILSTICDEVEHNEFGPKLEQFGLDLIATMKAKNGLGLAAPQVGINKRVFVMEQPDNKGFPPLVVCNPRLILTGRTLPGREGCLSLPNVFEQVYRAEGVVLQYQNALGVAHEIIYPTQMNARVAQHENDHLDGIMFFNYQDKREMYVTKEYPTPRGARMSKNLSKGVLRRWEDEKR